MKMAGRTRLFTNKFGKSYALYVAVALIVSSGCNSPEKPVPLMAAEQVYFSAIANNDVKLPAAKAGDWRFEHNEATQTFDSYRLQCLKNERKDHNTIYLKPVGQFTPEQQQALELTRQYVNIFFQTKTLLLNTGTDNYIASSAKRFRDHHIQLLAPYLLDSILLQQVPKNAHALMAFTAKDLYPSNNWNYVFGLASYQKRVGVTSLYRLKSKSADNRTAFLRRLLNISSHEIGHMFSISHCSVNACVMNGGNSLQELDLQPNRLCSDCQKKLFWRLRYNNQKRLKELHNFLSANQLKNDDLLLRDLNSVEQ